MRLSTIATLAAGLVPLARADLMDAAKWMPKVLVYTMTAGFRHDSIPTAIQVLKDRSADWRIDFTFTEDMQFFTDGNLSQFDNLLFVHTTEEILDDNGKAALQRYFQNGGNWMGVHATSGCLYNDTNFGTYLGAYFDFHPYQQNATFMPIGHDHPSTEPVPDQWTFLEEVYFFNTDPRDKGAKVVVTVNDSSYVNNVGDWPPMGSPHPIAWYIENPTGAQPLAEGAPKAGRSFYTALGHYNETWQDPTYQAHIVGGLKWTLDGASTLAYGVGKVGSTNLTLPPAPVTTTAQPSSTSGSGQGSAQTAAVAANKNGGAPSAVLAPSAVIGMLVAGLAALL